MYKHTTKPIALVLALALVMSLAMAAPASASSSPSGFEIKDGVLTKYTGPGGDVVIPDGVTSIGKDAFTHRDVTSVTIPDSVTSIGEFAFMGCKSLASVAIPDGVTSIGRLAFSGCIGLTGVTIPGSVTSIEIGAFDNCTSLTSVTIPDGVTSIENATFSGCTSLTSVTIPNSVTSIKHAAFHGCTSLTSVAIPDSVTSIERTAFYGCTSLTSVTIPNSVTSIGYMAFHRCTGLTSVTIPDSVTNIETSAFGRCSSLKNVYYAGTESQWNAIQIGEANSDLTEATIHYNGSGAAPTQPEKPAQPTLPTVEDIPATGTAVPTPQTVKLNGKDVQFQTYALKDEKGNLTNYVKIRDLADALNGTKAQFNVSWDGKAVVITSNTAYAPDGSEGSTPYSGSQTYKAVSDTPVSFDGKSVNLTSLRITYQNGGYTYYKVRDLGQLLDFEVRYDGGVIIETDKPYTGK